MHHIELVYEVVKHCIQRKEKGEPFPIMAAEYEFTRHFAFKRDELRNALIEALDEKLLLGRYRIQRALAGRGFRCMIDGVTMKGHLFVRQMEEPKQPPSPGKIGFI